MRAKLLLLTGALLFQPLLGAGQAQQSQQNSLSADCADGTTPKQNSSRVYIALRNGKDGSGKSMDDARDGSTAAAFDTILRCYSEGCTDPDHPQNSVAKTENLVVCLGPGTFRTKGDYDFLIGVPHKTQEGFTLGKGWKVHGQGVDKTTVQLSAYLTITNSHDERSYPLETGMNTVFSTNSDDASGIEISDLTVDANFPELKGFARGHGVKALNLEAIHLRSNEGSHWIHNVKVIHAAGEVGGMNEKYETFPVWIVSVRQNASPADNNHNIIENVVMTDFYGGACTAIAVANAIGEVRNNMVNGYQIGYGGWSMGEVYFHDNTATNTDYGFNIDSLNNNGVRIESNRIIHPQKYGFVIGGGGTYANFKILNNTVLLNKPGAAGLIFQGNVTHATVAGNKLQVEGPSIGQFKAMRIFSAHGTGPNHDNVYQSNQIAAGLKAAFEGPSQKSQNCFFGNHDEDGRPDKNMPDNHNGPCVQ